MKVASGLSTAEAAERRIADDMTMEAVEKMLNAGIAQDVVVDRMLTRAVSMAVMLSGQSHAAQFLANSARAVENGMFAHLSGEARKQ